MRGRSVFVVAFAVAGALIGASAAWALDADGPVAQLEVTTTTATTAPLVATSSLALTVPGTVNLSTGIGAGAGPLVATMGPVAVVDSGGVVARTWTATVSTTDFVGGPSTIPKALVAYASGPATSVTAGALAVPGQPDVAAPVALASPVVAFTGTGTTQETTVVWNPTVVITFPPDLVAGVYQGTFTHSVA